MIGIPGGYLYFVSEQKQNEHKGMALEKCNANGHHIFMQDIYTIEFDMLYAEQRIKHLTKQWVLGISEGYVEKRKTYARMPEIDIFEMSNIDNSATDWSELWFDAWIMRLAKAYNKDMIRAEVRNWLKPYAIASNIEYDIANNWANLWGNGIIFGFTDDHVERGFHEEGASVFNYLEVYDKAYEKAYNEAMRGEALPIVEEEDDDE